MLNQPPPHGPGCECNPATTMRIQLLRAVHSLIDAVPVTMRMKYRRCHGAAQVQPRTSFCASVVSFFCISVCRLSVDPKEGYLDFRAK